MQILEPQQFATWQDPVSILYACHGKVKRFCRQLQILPDYLQKNGVNQAVINDVKLILQYFNQAAPLHHEDEEQDFFPALVVKAPQAKQTVDELEKQHMNLHQNWQNLAQQLQMLIAGERDHIEQSLIEQFVAGYEKHIALEEPLFELGKEYLSDEQLIAMGKIMFARRQG